MSVLTRSSTSSWEPEPISGDSMDIGVLTLSRRRVGAGRIQRFETTLKAEDTREAGQGTRRCFRSLQRDNRQSGLNMSGETVTETSNRVGARACGTSLKKADTFWISDLRS